MNETTVSLPAVQENGNGNGSSTESTSRKYSSLAKILENNQEAKHLIILQGVPDPDAISSAMALQFICSRYEIESSIVYFAPISHHENRALVKRLGIKLERYSDKFDVSPFDLYSIVDSQKHYTPIDSKLKENNVQFMAFIDHHRALANTAEALFVDVREDVASTAAILCEYLKQVNPKGLEPTDAGNVSIATALMHGLRSDTMKFTNATRLEYEAASYIANCVDHQVIEQVERQTLTSSMLGILENALVNRRVHDNFIFSAVGFVRAADRDIIPQAAELLLSREGTDTVLVYGIVDEKTIDGSFRTRSETINPDEFLKGFLGFSPESGQYYGGGNVKDKGGFQIPLGFLCLHEDKAQVHNMAREIIETSFLDYIGKASQVVTKKA